MNSSTAAQRRHPRRFRDHSLGVKPTIIVSVALVPALVPGAMQAGRGSGAAMRASEVSGIAQKSRLVVDTLAVYESAMRSAAQRQHKTFLGLFGGPITIGPLPSRQVGDFNTPHLRVGDSTLNLDFRTVDRFTALIGAIAAEFARVGDHFVRVTASVNKEDGFRAVGTVLDNANPAWKLLMDGKPYIGRAVLFGTEYMTQYEPLLDPACAVVGATFIGFDSSLGLGAPEANVGRAKLGESGLFMVIDAQPGPDYGTFVVHPQMMGHSALALKDAKGNAYIEAFVLEREDTGAATCGRGRVERQLDAVGAFFRCMEPDRRRYRSGIRDRSGRIAAALAVGDRRVRVGGGVLPAAACGQSPHHRSAAGRGGRGDRSGAAGRLDVRLDAAADDEPGRVATARNSMVENLRERKRREAEHLARSRPIQQCLHAAESCFMVTDGDLRIVHVDSSLHKLLIGAADQMRTQLPDFDPTKVLGSSIDSFHRDAAHQRGMLSKLTGTHRPGLQICNRHYELKINPVNVDGARLGDFVAWRDLTLGIAVEEELSAVVAGAAAGDFVRPIVEDGKVGLYRQIAVGLNTLLVAVNTSLQQLQMVLAALAERDLTQSAKGESGGTLGRILDDSNRTADRLTGMIIGIKQSAESIELAARGTVQGNLDLSQCTEEQAASLQETASSMEPLTRNVTQNADSAQQSNQLASSAGEVAVRGGEAVAETIATMSGIDGVLRKTGEFIGVFDGSAFQTKILVLNAAVEAARSGEHGGGFAVVACEVRALAQRAAAAAKQIRTLIGDSAGQVSTGSALVSQAGCTMEEIVLSVRRVNDSMSEISAATEKQSSGIRQLSETVGQMDQTTQQNAALVEEASAAARSLESQPSRLLDAVARLCLTGGRSKSMPTDAQIPMSAARPLVQASALHRNLWMHSNKGPSVPLKPHVVAHARTLPRKRPAAVQSVGELSAVRKDMAIGRSFR